MKKDSHSTCELTHTFPLSNWTGDVQAETETETEPETETEHVYTTNYHDI